MKKILLVEPAYKNKYPPLGLMKLSNYHKLRGDIVKFVKGFDSNIRNQEWDRIYISTLFTFYWDITIKTIEYYKHSTGSLNNVIVGGVLASLQKEQIYNATKVNVIQGLLNKPGMLDKGDHIIIDTITPDYSILDEISYDYGLKDSYIGYATRGCPNQCGFCAVRYIEPEFNNYLPIKRQVRAIEELYGPKQNLILMDNNVLASSNFDKIISDIIQLGFFRGAKLNNKMRYIDFNQGIDIRLLDEKKMQLLSNIAIRPLRLAFDHISLKEKYISSVKLAAKYKIEHISNYILYNYTDTPEDFYNRLRISVELNEELGTKIYSFPMKYIPLTNHDRKYVGKYWNNKLLRGVQCILLATRGKIGPNLDFFNAAFGKTAKEFIEIAMMPEDYIINRQMYINNKAIEWKKAFRELSEIEKEELVCAIEDGIQFNQSDKVSSILIHYKRRKHKDGFT
jgi:hypothetical protein